MQSFNCFMEILIFQYALKELTVRTVPETVARVVSTIFVMRTVESVSPVLSLI